MSDNAWWSSGKEFACKVENYGSYESYPTRISWLYIWGLVFNLTARIQMSSMDKETAY